MNKDEYALDASNPELLGSDVYDPHGSHLQSHPGVSALKGAGHEDVIDARHAHRTSKMQSGQLAYVERRKYGGAEFDEDDADEELEHDPKYQASTPLTKKRLFDDKVKKNVKKLSPAWAFATLIKSFVCSAVIYLPRSYVNGGWGFQIIVLVISAVLTIFCAMRLM